MKYISYTEALLNALKWTGVHHATVKIGVQNENENDPGKTNMEECKQQSWDQALNLLLICSRWLYMCNWPVDVRSRNCSSFIRVAFVSSSSCRSSGGMKNADMPFTVIYTDTHTQRIHLTCVPFRFYHAHTWDTNRQHSQHHKLFPAAAIPHEDADRHSHPAGWSQIKY